MKQFGYRPPSAGRSLIRNSEHEEEEVKNEDEEKVQLEKIRAYISKIIKEYLR
jgi:hypothetical protein